MCNNVNTLSVPDVEDLIYFKNEFPKRHKNPFTVITKEEFDKRIDKLIENVDKIGAYNTFVNFCEVFAAIKDSHSGINIVDGRYYPLAFFIFENEFYVINVDNSLCDMLHAKIVRINNVDIEDIAAKVKLIIPHENNNRALHLLPRYIGFPRYMYGLEVITDYNQTIFTIEKDGKTKDIIVPICFNGVHKINWLKQDCFDVVTGKYIKNYDYQYIKENEALLFNYNSCKDMPDNPFTVFADDMLNFVYKNSVEKIIVDLRRNTGGNSTVLQPFIKGLKKYIEVKPDTKVYILVGRKTFSSGMFAIYDIMDTVPNAISIGEPTGGGIDRFGEQKIFNLPHSQIEIKYSHKYFEFSKIYKYQNSATNTFIPDVVLPLTFEDYVEKNDIALNHALDN